MVKLFCTVCKGEVGLRKAIIQQHISLSKHCREKIKLKGKLPKEKDITEILIQYDNEMLPKGENVSMEQRVYRFKVVRTFLKPGFAINKIDQFRSLFEEQGDSLTHSFHLSHITNVISREEREREKKRISGKRVSIIFDGTTHVAEALNIVRFVSELENQERKVEQRLVRLLFVTKTMNGE